MVNDKSVPLQDFIMSEKLIARKCLKQEFECSENDDQTDITNTSIASSLTDPLVECDSESEANHESYLSTAEILREGRRKCGNYDYNHSFSHSFPFIPDSNPILDACFQHHEAPDFKSRVSPNSAHASLSMSLLDPPMAKRVVEYAHRRLAKSQVHSLSITPTSRSQSPPKVVSHSDVSVDQLLGLGSFSAVYSLNNDPVSEETDDRSEIAREKGTKYVLKVLRKQLLQQPSLLAASAAGLMKEGLMLHHCQHPNVLKIHAWGTKFGLEGYASGRSDAFFLILEHLSCTLYDKLDEWREQKRVCKQRRASERRRRLLRSFVQRLPVPKRNKVSSENQGKSAENDNVDLEARCQVLLDLARGVSYLHSQNIIHRDLKPDNVGFDSDGTLKIFDLGMARVLPQLREEDDLYHFTQKVGSHRYMSPECARGEAYNAKADVYTVALMIHEVYTLKKPFGVDVPPLDPMGIYFDPTMFSRDDDTRPPLPFSVLRPQKNNQNQRKFKDNVAAPKWPSSLVQLLETGWGNSVQDRPTMAEFQQQLEEQIIPEIIS